MSASNDRRAELVEQFLAGRLDRRAFLQRSAALGLSTTAAALFAAELVPSAGAQPSEIWMPSGPAGTLRVRLVNDITGLDPAYVTTNEQLSIFYCTYEGLLGYRPGTWTPVNVLADQFRSSRDNLRHNFTLKQGIQFHGDFGEVTTEDVKFSIERIAGRTKPKIASPQKSDWQLLDRIVVHDRYSGTIFLSEPSALLPGILASTSIVSKKAVRQFGSKFATHPIGTGPYEFVEWVPAQRVVLRRFQAWSGAFPHRNAPFWPTIEAKVITDDNAAALALQSGELDYGSISTGSFGEFAKSKAFAVHSRTTLEFQFLSMNAQNPALRNINVRRAVRYGIDIPGIIQAAYDGHATRSIAEIPPGVLGYWRSAPKYNRDVEKAKAFLAKAGVSSAKLKLLVFNFAQHRAVGQIVQQNLNDVGIRVDLDVSEPGAFGRKWLAPDSHLVYNWFGVRGPDPWFYMDYWDCASKDVNILRLCSSVYQRQLGRLAARADRAQRAQLAIKMQKFVDRSARAVWVVHPVALSASTKGIRPVLRPDGFPYFWAFERI